MGKRGLWQVQRGEAWLLKLGEKARSFYSTDKPPWIWGFDFPRFALVLAFNFLRQ